MTAWDDYCAAAQRLDAIRRGAASAAGEQAQAVRVAREELTAVRARLVPQQARLRESGIPDDELRPSVDDAAAAGQAMTGGPTEVLVALRHARATADTADAALLGAGGGPTGAPRVAGRRAAALRNLLVYGPFAAAVLLAQIALYLSAGEGRSRYALGCALLLPVLAFALGWLGIGIAFPAPPGERVDRTAAFGAVVCAVPLVLTAIVAGLLWIVS
jgi:hypothetical protein